MDTFIHAPILSYNKVMHILELTSDAKPKQWLICTLLGLDYSILWSLAICNIHT